MCSDTLVDNPIDFLHIRLYLQNKNVTYFNEIQEMAVSLCAIKCKNMQRESLIRRLGSQA